MKYHELRAHIVIDNDIRFGKPCIKGTRITVGDILQWLATGMSEQEILEDFPELQNIHIKAALAFAAERDAITKVIVHETVADCVSTIHKGHHILLRSSNLHF